MQICAAYVCEAWPICMHSLCTALNTCMPVVVSCMALVLLRLVLYYQVSIPGMFQICCGLLHVHGMDACMHACMHTWCAWITCMQPSPAVFAGGLHGAQVGLCRNSHVCMLACCSCGLCMSRHRPAHTVFPVCWPGYCLLGSLAAGSASDVSE